MTADQPAAEDPATNGVAGTWTVDSSVGEFSYEDSRGRSSDSGSTRSCRRSGRPGGRSHSEITGLQLVVEGTTVTAVTIEADTTAITTNESRRDDKVQDATRHQAVPHGHVRADPTDRARRHRRLRHAGELGADGELTIHGVTTPVTILEAQLVGDHVVSGRSTSCSPTTG